MAQVGGLFVQGNEHLGPCCHLLNNGGLLIFFLFSWIYIYFLCYSVVHFAVRFTFRFPVAPTFPFYRPTGEWWSIDLVVSISSVIILVIPRLRRNLVIKKYCTSSQSRLECHRLYRRQHRFNDRPVHRWHFLYSFHLQMKCSSRKFKRLVIFELNINIFSSE